VWQDAGRPGAGRGAGWPVVRGHRAASRSLGQPGPCCRGDERDAEYTGQRAEGGGRLPQVRNTDGPTVATHPAHSTAVRGRMKRHCSGALTGRRGGAGPSGGLLGGQDPAIRPPYRPAGRSYDSAQCFAGRESEVAERDVAFVRCREVGRRCEGDAEQIEKSNGDPGVRMVLCPAGSAPRLQRQF